MARKRKIPIIRRREVLSVLYNALRAFQTGALARENSIGVGVLPLDLSGIYLAVERELERAT